MNIYVGNLPYSANEQDIRALFSPFGEVKSVKVIIDRLTGSSKGFAFVEMANAAEALQAISQLNGKEIGGRGLRVNEAQDRPERSTRDSHRGGGYGSPREGGSRDNRGGGYMSGRNRY